MEKLLGFLAIFGHCICLTLLPAQAQEIAITTPRGIYTLKVAGKPAGQSQARTYFGVQLLPDIRFQGLASNVAGTSLRFNEIPYSSFADAERKSYIHVMDGNGRGFIVDIEEFRANDFRCANDLTGWIQPGTKVSLRPHPHLADLFGADNKFGLTSGSGADAADNVVVWDPVAQQEKVYYFHSSRSRWEEEGIESDASRAIMRFPYGFYIVRRTPGTLRIVLSGTIGADPLLLPVRTGANVFSLPVNLSASLENLVSATGDFPVLSGVNSSQADLLTFEEPFTGNQRGPFYHSSRPNAEGWREIGETAGGTGDAMDLLSTLILRRTGAPGYVRVEGSLVPNPSALPLPPDPEPGETPLMGEMAIPPGSSDRFLQVQTSTDLQTWSPVPGVTLIPGSNTRVEFPLPGGQTRSFYRLIALPYWY